MQVNRHEWANHELYANDSMVEWSMFRTLNLETRVQVGSSPGLEQLFKFYMTLQKYSLTSYLLNYF